MNALIFKIIALTGSVAAISFTPVINTLNGGESSYCIITLKAGEASEKNMIHFEGETEGSYTTQRSFRVSKGYTWKKAKDLYQGKIVNAVNLYKPGDPNLEYLFGYWSYDDGINAIDDNYQFVEDSITLTPRWYLSSYGPEKFVEDYWESIITIATQGYEPATEPGKRYFGLEALKKFYNPNGNTFVLVPDDFIDDTEPGGLTSEKKIARKTRTVKLYDVNNPTKLKEYKVRVVAENHDFVSGNDGYLSCLTFQFVDTVKDGLSFDYYGPNDKNYMYSGSAIRKYIESVVYSKMDSDVKKAIVKVNKKESKNSVYKSEKITETATFDTKLYLPSSNEVYINADDRDQYYYSEMYRENNQFDYYLRYRDDSSKRVKTKNQMLRSTTIDTNLSKTYYESKKPLYIDNNGALKDMSVITPCSFAPVFSIGVEKNVNRIYFDSPNFEFHGDALYSNYAYTNNQKDIKAVINCTNSSATYTAADIQNAIKIYVDDLQSPLADGFTITDLKDKSSTYGKNKYLLTINNNKIQNKGDISISLYMES